MRNPSELTRLETCPCGIKVEALPIDVAYFETGLGSYVIQRTCERCKGTALEELSGEPETLLVQLLAANNLMTKGNDEFRRRLLANEAILKLFREAVETEKQLARQASHRNL